MAAKPSSSFGVTKVLTALKSRHTPSLWAPRLRELSYGSYAGGMWQWTYASARTYIAIIAEGKMTPENFIGWAALTKEVEPLPVFGVYIREDRRGLGYAEDVVNHLLNMYPQEQGECYAASRYWSEWPRVLGNHGLVHVEWV